MISSTNSVQIKEIEKLQKKTKYRKEMETFIVEGRKMVEEAGAHIRKIYVSESYREAHPQTEGILKEHEYEVVTDKVMKEISETTTPQGIMATVRMPQYSLFDYLMKEEATYILLENLQDPGNLGTIMRTAEGAGVTAIILSRDSVDIFNPKVVRATMGSIFRVPFIYVEDFLETMGKLKQADVTLYATHLFGKNEYDQEVYAGKSGIIIGNEANGITKIAEKEADCLVRIPMEGKLESLNAAVASALMMYEVFRQKRNKGK